MTPRCSRILFVSVFPIGADYSKSITQILSISIVHYPIRVPNWIDRCSIHYLKNFLIFAHPYWYPFLYFSVFNTFANMILFCSLVTKECQCTHTALFSISCLASPCKIVEASWRDGGTSYFRSCTTFYSTLWSLLAVQNRNSVSVCLVFLQWCVCINAPPVSISRRYHKSFLTLSHLCTSNRNRKGIFFSSKDFVTRTVQICHNPLNIFVSALNDVWYEKSSWR